jgi:hypothetical protein
MLGRYGQRNRRALTISRLKKPSFCPAFSLESPPGRVVHTRQDNWCRFAVAGCSCGMRLLRSELSPSDLNRRSTLCKATKGACGTLEAAIKRADLSRHFAVRVLATRVFEIAVQLPVGRRRAAKTRRVKGHLCGEALRPVERFGAGMGASPFMLVS